MAGIELRNGGLISLRRTHALVQHTGARTLIVSGLARSGTSMVARVLNAAGVPMGDRLDDVVFEDHDFLELLAQQADLEALDGLIRRRDAAHPVWGFKRPHLHPHGPAILSRFRNPSLIMTVRDPVAVAERNAIAEHLDQANALATAMDDLGEMMRFARTADCPVLLVSYEKAVQHRDRFVERLLEFCGLPCSVPERRRLCRLVEPDRPAYVESARRVFDGYVDGVQGTVLSGWGYQRLLGQPLTLTVFRDDVPVADCLADRHRQDLADAGIDDGRHGFSIDLAGHGFVPDSRVTVRVKDRSFALNNSGSSMTELGADPDSFRPEPVRHWALTPFG